MSDLDWCNVGGIKRKCCGEHDLYSYSACTCRCHRRRKNRGMSDAQFVVFAMLAASAAVTIFLLMYVVGGWFVRVILR